MRALLVFPVSLAACAVILSGVAHAAPPVTSVLVMPVSCRDADANTCKTLTDALTHEAGRIPGYRVVATTEVEQALGGDRMRQLAGCDSTSCALEIAGAANTDELVVGSLGHVGSELVLTLSRLASRDATIRFRALRRAPDSHAEKLLDELPNAVNELFQLPAMPMAPLHQPAVETPMPPVPPPAPVHPSSRFRDDGEPPTPPTQAALREALQEMSADDVYRHYAVRMDGTDVHLGNATVTRHNTLQRILGLLILNSQVRSYLESDPEAAAELPGGVFQGAQRVVCFFMLLFLALGFAFLLVLPVGLFVLLLAAIFGVVDVILSQTALSSEEKAAQRFNHALQQRIDQEARPRSR